MIRAASDRLAGLRLPRGAPSSWAAAPPSRGLLGRGLSSSSSARGLPQIPPEEMGRLNRASASLYRLLLRECRDAVASSSGASGLLLLQPPVDHRDQGAARWLDSSVCSAWPYPPSPSVVLDGTRDEGVEDGKGASRIVDFFLRWSSVPASAAEVEEEDLARRAAMLIARNIGLHHLDILPTKRPSGGGEDDASKREYILASSTDLSGAVRKAFLRVSPCGKDEALRDSLTKADVVRLQRRAIDAVRLLHSQKELSRCTTVTEDKEKGVRVVATSGWIGHTSHDGHWFAYRIRVENFRRPSLGPIVVDRKSHVGSDGAERTEAEERIGCGETGSDVEGGDPDDTNGAMQLLGRHWVIREFRPEKDSEGDAGDYAHDSPIVVPAPKTGAVGHHPVIHPGQIFEYLSQSKIRTLEGEMLGKFYLANVPGGTKNGMVGDPIEALMYPDGDERLFEAEVGPFRLSVPDVERGDEQR